ncbi:MAG: hypothetical protein K2Y01_05000 [Rhabdochlamydiaceae bacterium]|nr:hypothetical protein [Rhabdochlamydiaceae bacterium]
MSIKSFAGSDHYRPVLHNIYSLGRTNTLYHLLFSPNAESLERLLKGIFAKTVSQSFSSPEVAKEFVQRELSNIHPVVLEKYQKDIVLQDSVEKIQLFARKSFQSLSNSELKGLVVKMKADLGKRVLDKDTVISSIGDMWRLVIRGKQPVGVSLKEYAVNSLFTVFPFLAYNSSLDALKIQEYLATCKREIDQLANDEEIKQYATGKHDARDRDLSFLRKNLEQQLESTLTSTWRRVLQMAKERAGSESTIESVKSYAIAKLQLFPIAIQNLYHGDLSLSKDIFDLQQRIEGYLNDSISAQYTSGMRSTKATSAGTQGYPKIIDLQRKDKLMGFMKHVSGSKEMQIHRLYKFLLEECFQLNGHPPCFQVPQGVMLDAVSDRVVYTNTFGDLAGPSRPAENSYVKNLLSWMALANTKRDLDNVRKEIEFHNLVQTRPIGFFELINSSNLSEFFLTHYLSLSSEKKKEIFTRLGMIAFLDFLLGNQDRLVRLDRLAEQSFSDVFYAEDGFSNIGNLMISADANAFYAIDNTIGHGESFSEMTQEQDSEERAAYLSFLTSMLALEDFNAQLASRLLQSLTQTFIELREECDIEDIRNLQKQGKDMPQNLILEEMRTDHEALHQAVQEGIHIMRSYVRDVMGPVWNGSEAAAIRSRLDKDLVDTIQERLHLVTTIGV